MKTVFIMEKIEVKNETPHGAVPTRNYTQKIVGLKRFGRELKISPKSTAMICDPGFKVEFFCKMVNVCIDIGENHSADLIMTEEAWEEFKKGADISITTVKEFKESIK